MFCVSKISFSKLFFSFLKLCLLVKVVCISFVLVILIAFLISTIVMYEGNCVLVHNDTTMSFAFQLLCKEHYLESCLDGGECYVVSIKDEQEAVACMCTSFLEVLDVKNICGGRKIIKKTTRQNLLKRRVTICF